MENDLDFAGLSASAKRLNQRSDSFHTTLMSILQKLVKLGIGLEVWDVSSSGFVSVITHDRTENAPQQGWVLGLTKFNGAWCIAIRDAFRYNGRVFLHDETYVTPLLEASRERRIEALRVIPSLVQRLHQEADFAGRTMDEALAFAKSLDASL